MSSPRPSRFRILGRALRMRCPHCGVGSVMASWFTVRPRCPACGFRFERGQDEEHDYWLGAYLLNFLATEIVFGMALLLALLLTWPDPPWTRLLGGGAAVMVVMPIVFYPLAKTLWLAIDLLFRPAQPEDFAA